MQSILSEGTVRWGLLSHAPLITQTCFLLVPVQLPRFLGIASAEKVRSSGACSLGTLQVPAAVPPNKVPQKSEGSRCSLIISYVPDIGISLFPVSHDGGLTTHL